MRKLLCSALIFCCLFGICACADDNAVPEDSVTVYFKREKPVFGTADGIIGTTYLEAEGHMQDHTYLLNKYFRTVPDAGFVSAFPKGLAIISFKQEGLTAKVVLTDCIADLSGMELTIALVCITQTVMSLTGCQEVIISAYSRQLDGQNFITLNRDSYLLLDNSGAPQK